MRAVPHVFDGKDPVCGMATEGWWVRNCVGPCSWCVCRLEGTCRGVRVTRDSVSGDMRLFGVKAEVVRQVSECLALLSPSENDCSDPFREADI